MKAELVIRCEGCQQRIGEVKMDTADMPDELQFRINAVILAHRPNCRYYGGDAGQGVDYRSERCRG